jgi:hypothetical protein
MRASDIVKPEHLYVATVFVKQPGYTGNLDITVSAKNHFEARQLMKRMYNVPDARIGSIRQLKRH